MAKKEPYREGSLQKIARLLIGPILSRMPSDGDVTDWLTQMMGLNEREVLSYKVLEPFHMPGVWLEQPNVRRPFPKGPRDILEDTTVWVRADIRDKGRVNIEVTGRGVNTGVFDLAPVEWWGVRRFLKRGKRA